MKCSMKRHLKHVVFILLFVSGMLSAAAQRGPIPVPEKEKKEKKSNLPKLVVDAQFVMVISQREADFNQSPDMDDRVTVADAESAIRKWGRYRIVYRKDEADLIFSVRRDLGARIRAGRGPSPGGDIASSGGDHLAVFNAHTGTGGAALWRKSQRDGLARPDYPLLKAFQDEVEAAAKIP